MDKKVIDITKHIKNKNKNKNIRSYEMDVSEAYAEELTEKFRKILKEEKNKKD